MAKARVTTETQKATHTPTCTGKVAENYPLTQAEYKRAESAYTLITDALCGMAKLAEFLNNSEDYGSAVIIEGLMEGVDKAMSEIDRLQTALAPKIDYAPFPNTPPEQITADDATKKLERVLAAGGNRADTLKGMIETAHYAMDMRADSQ